MPTILSHAIAAASLGRIHSHSRRSGSIRFWALTAFCSMLPDVDVIGFPLGVRYADALGHRGLTHSFFFAVVVGCAAAAVYGGSEEQDPPSVLHAQDPPCRGGRGLLFGPGARMTWFGTGGALALYFAAITATHPLLDALTDGGLGVALFAPFSPARYFLPWRPIEVSPIGPSFFSERGFHVLISEIRWVWLPSLALVLICRRFAKTG